MWMCDCRTMFTAVILFICAVFVNGNDDNYLFTTDRLPDEAIRPTLANGNIGFVVYGDAVHLNGVYNGFQGNSHRAHIPNYANIQLAKCALDVSNPTACSYQLDMKRSMFVTVYEEPSRSFRVVQEVFPHRYFEGIVVNKFRIQRLYSQDRVQIDLKQLVVPLGIDITFNTVYARDINGVQYNVLCGTTNQVEDPRYQALGHNVCVFYPSYPMVLELAANRTAEEFFFYTGFGRTTYEIETQLKGIGTSGAEPTHINRMKDFWDRYGIFVEGNDNLDRVLKASAFYLFSSLPLTNFRFPDAYAFYGLSPSGLGRGGAPLQDYQGLNFWDTEIWMFPVILLLDPENAKQLLQYRTITSRAAADNAADGGHKGWRYSWKSGFTGVEGAASCCPEVAQFQHHITADVAYAARQYYLATFDQVWMRREGCEMGLETARFWKSRSVYNNETDLYEVRNIMGPDEDHYDIDNNAFTNVIAAHNLFFGEFSGCVCSESRDEYREFARVGKAMTIPYDEANDYHPQFTNYTIGTPITQADAILLGYPLEFPMNETTRLNDLDIYGNVTQVTGPAMTWAMHTIGLLDTEQFARADEMFAKSYRDYVRQPFNVWSESASGIGAANNFISGAGGFLQSVINGYGAVRLRHEQLVVGKPRLLPLTTRLYIPEINYMGVKMFLDINRTTNLLGVKPYSTLNNVQIFVDGTRHDLCIDCNISFTNGVVIQPANVPVINDCRLHKTEFGIKLADQNHAASLKFSSQVSIITLIVFVLRKLGIAT